MKPDNKKHPFESPEETIERLTEEIETAIEMLQKQDPILRQRMLNSQLCQECAAIIRMLRWHKH